MQRDGARVQSIGRNGRAGGHKLTEALGRSSNHECADTGCGSRGTHIDRTHVDRTGKSSGAAMRFLADGTCDNRNRVGLAQWRDCSSARSDRDAAAVRQEGASRSATNGILLEAVVDDRIRVGRSIGRCGACNRVDRDRPTVDVGDARVAGRSRGLRDSRVDHCVRRRRTRAGVIGMSVRSQGDRGRVGHADECISKGARDEGQTNGRMCLSASLP